MYYISLANSEPDSLHLQIQKILIREMVSFFYKVF